MRPPQVPGSSRAMSDPSSSPCSSRYIGRWQAGLMHEPEGALDEAANVVALHRQLAQALQDQRRKGAVEEFAVQLIEEINRSHRGGEVYAARLDVAPPRQSIN